MKNRKLPYRVFAINTAIVILIGIIVGIANAQDGFAFALGVVCLAGGLLYLFAGLILYATSSKEWGKGFLMTAGTLLLLSGISCGTGLANTNFH